MTMHFRQSGSRFTEEELAYLLATASMILCVLVIGISAKIGYQPAPAMFLVPFALTLYGFAQFIEGVVASVRKSKLAGVLAIIITIPGAGFLAAASGVLVNWSLKVPSAAFPHTQAMAAFLSVPLTAMVALPLTLLFATPFLVMCHALGQLPATLRGLFSERRQIQSDAGGIVLGFRLLILMLLLPTAALITLQVSGPYSQWMEEVVRWYAFHFEAEEFSHCLLSNGERIAYLDGDLVVRAVRGEHDFSFSVGVCNSSLNEGAVNR